LPEPVIEPELPERMVLPEPDPAPPEPAPANGTGPPRSTEPRPLKRDPKMLVVLNQAGEIEAATRLVRSRLARAGWPLSALTAEARAVGIGEAAF
jgi:hypothetical protein